MYARSAVTTRKPPAGAPQTHELDSVEALPAPPNARTPTPLPTSTLLDTARLLPTTPTELLATRLPVTDVARPEAPDTPAPALFATVLSAMARLFPPLRTPPAALPSTSRPVA